jgi:hypothetical protein
MTEKKVNERIEKDCDPCPRCNRTKRWTHRGDLNPQYSAKCTFCGHIFGER